MNGLDWVDNYISDVRDILHVRREDNLLIIAPNQSYKLNPSALELLEKLLKGHSIRDLLPGIEKDDGKSRQVAEFFLDIKSLVSGCFRETDKRTGIDVKPFKRPHNTLPVLSEIAVTYRCNLDCVFCYAGCSCHSKPGAGEMTTDEIKRVLKIIKEQAKVPTVSFTGGEPTLRSDLPELVETAKDIGMRVNLITNGTSITQSLAKELAEAGLDSAQVSLEGPDEKIHDAMTQVPGSFKKTLRGIEALRQTGIHLHTHTTITTINEPHLERQLALIKSLGFPRFSMNQLIPTGTGGKDQERWIHYSEIGAIVERIRKLSRRMGLEFMWYSPTPLCMYNPMAAGLGNKSCAACDGLLSVSPTGGVLPCSSFDKDVGNLLKTDFKEVWNSKNAAHYRDKKYAPNHCQGCAEFEVCSAACPLYWDAVGYSELYGVEVS